MAKLPDYQPRGVRTASVPALRPSAVAIRAPSRQSLAVAVSTSDSLISTLDRLNAQLFREAADMQYKRGLQYGIENAPSAQQVMDAVNSGADAKELFLGGNTFFGQGSLKAQAGLVATELHAKGEQAVAEVLTQIDSGEINSLDQVKAKIQGATEGLAKALDNVSPEEALRLRASMATLGNAAVVKASKAIIAKQKDQAKLQVEASMQDAPKIIESVIGAGDSIDPTTGRKVTVDMKLDVYKSQLFRSLAAIGDPEYAKTTMERFNKMREGAARQAVTKYLIDGYSSHPWQTLSALRKGNAGEMSSVYQGLTPDAQEKVRVDYMQEVGRIDTLARKGEADSNRSLRRSYGADYIEVEDMPEGPEKDVARRALATKYSRILPTSELRSLIDPKHEKQPPDYDAEVQFSTMIQQQGISDPAWLQNQPGYERLNGAQRAKLNKTILSAAEKEHNSWKKRRAGIPDNPYFVPQGAKLEMSLRIDQLDADGRQASKIANNGNVDLAWVRDYIEKHLNSGKEDSKVKDAKQYLDALNISDGATEADIRARYPAGKAAEIIKRLRAVKGQ